MIEQITSLITKLVEENRKRQAIVNTRVAAAESGKLDS
jgi:hypothetical protein